MKRRTSSVLLAALLMSGCESCQREIIRELEVLGSVKFVLVRISGVNHINLAKPDNGDNYVAENGYLCVTHTPGCGWWGNSGTDEFFSPDKPLPPLCTVVGVNFTQLWPNGIASSASGGTLGGWGSYGAKFDSGSYSYVDWKNACQGVFGGKNLHYRISFIVSMPQGTDLGEDTLDQASPISGCKIAGFSEDPQPSGPSTPQFASPSGFSGQVLYCNVTPAVAGGKLHIEATCTHPLSGAQGSGSMSVDVPVSFQPSGGGVPAVSQFNTGTAFQQGTWQITKAQIVGLTGALPGLPLTVNLPGNPGSPVLDFTSGGQCVR
jgi:hypothetical protein